MKILIIQTAFIGDIVLVTPLIEKLKDRYKNCEITFLTTPVGKTLLEGDENLKEVIAYDKRGRDKGLKGLLKIGKKLREKKFDEVICLHRYLRSSVLTYLTGAKVRKGYKNASGSIFLNKKIEYKKGAHEVERVLSFVEENEEKRYEIKLYSSLKDKRWVDDKLEKISGKIVVIAPGSKWFTKMWPVEYFNRLIKMLEEREGVDVVVVGGKDEKKLGVEVESGIDLIGETTLLQLKEVISRGVVLVTNDSSPIHIGSSCENTHILAIFGATIKEFGFYPWSKNSQVIENNDLPCRPCGIHGGSKCPKEHFKCMLEITPEMVYKKIVEKL